MPKIGAHVSAAISLDLSLDRAMKIGAQCTQIFISPPQQWSKTIHNDQEIEKYLKKMQETGIGPNFIHSTYLINLASLNPEVSAKSVDWLIFALDSANKLGIKGVIFHIGSFTGQDQKQAMSQVINLIEKILLNTTDSYLILENSAGAGNLIGDKFEELGEIIRVINNPRLQVCLDTQHAFAAGYDLRTRDGLDKTIDDFDLTIGLNKLAVIHINDSKVDLGSNRDRHENIGEGFIGIEGFRNIVNYPDLKDIPFILEVPGFSNGGPDQNNIQLLKSLIK